MTICLCQTQYDASNKDAVSTCCNKDFHDCDEQGRMRLGTPQPQCYGPKVIRYRKCLWCGCIYKWIQDHPSGESFELFRRHTWKDTITLKVVNWVLMR
jgi:hypothetical protein